ncbi:hypothetical protein [uncultured Cocleimonas sp.]|uniref:hypothetical protein n=1 Tax=uncultured Cocleimonas sp. TaxID=1051587 RepID=UPI002629B489|nr:hypothetical protein [uncultured Cocleimonas sp.]
MFVVEASYFGNSEINTYDPTTGYYYKAIVAVDEGKGGLLSSSKSTRKITNIAIYQPSTDSHKLLFKKDIERSISFVFFESAYKNNTIQFNGAEGTYNPAIKNNTSVAERKPNDKLLIGFRDDDKKVTDLWVSKKDGTELQKLTSVRFGSTWHIDVKNSVLRVVTISNQDLKIKNYP